MTVQRFIPADRALVHQRPGSPPLIEIPEASTTYGEAIVYEHRCDVRSSCDGDAQPRMDHNLTLVVDGPGYPPTKLGFSCCAACCRDIVPNSVRLMLAAFGVDLPPGLMPDA